jgi:hypothetical protein
MKTPLLIATFFIYFNLFAQSDTQSLNIFEKHNEVKLGVIKLLSGPVLMPPMNTLKTEIWAMAQCY